MTIVSLSDLHGSIRALEHAREYIEAADLVVLCGDITHFGGRAEAEPILDAISSMASRLLAVSGNCDTRAVDEVLDERGLNLHGTHRELDGIWLAGLGGSLPAPAFTPNTYSESEIEELLAQAEKGSGRPLVLLSHQPPRDTAADRITGGRHVGSTAVRSFIERVRPVLCLSGHIHESAGVDAIGGCRVANAGPFSGGGLLRAVVDRTGTATVEVLHVDLPDRP